ncbi:MAG TPA: Clp protease N-terminal domain-containing protein [Pirellulales bacterium]|nr:Clp protease N-terminal domain-containing protein [Pirellulales bacterium]
MRERESVAFQVLTNFGLRLEAAREEVLNLVGYGL